ncbi:MAG TPA: PH domain-containing protein [Candidatus Microsaccharimonas sp.]|jgi:uncharacterized membrane protein YdbT with pleckstrin-like domain
MKPDESNTVKDDYNQPVAYDAEGRPLYAHPPTPPAAPTTLTQTAAQQVVHIARSMNPIKQDVSEDIQKRHERSARLYPSLNLSENEYIISALRRHPIGLIIPLVLGAFLITVALIVLSNYAAIVDALSIQGSLAEASVITVPVLLFCVVVALGMFISYYVYTNNRFYLTNESVIQEIQISLFSQHEQTISLGNIEDASYYQEGLLQQIINYGTIRLSTQGDENTYRFNYAPNPRQHIATLNNAVEAFKNGRPVED